MAPISDIEFGVVSFVGVSMMKFYGSLYRMFPEQEPLFLEIEGLLSNYYRRRLEMLAAPSEDEVLAELNRFIEAIQSLTVNLQSRSVINVNEYDFPLNALSKLVNHSLSFLFNSYLVKSAALLEGFIWSINLRNAFVGAMCIRQEIEILAASHYACFLCAEKKFLDPKDYFAFINAVLSMVFGQRSNSTEAPISLGFFGEPYKAVSVGKMIQVLDKDEMRESVPWLGELYGSLSEIVHPNWKSNSIHMREGEHFWQVDYANSSGLLSEFLIYARLIFDKALAEISKLPSGHIDSGFKLTQETT